MKQITVKVQQDENIRKGDFVMLEYDEETESWYAVKFDPDKHLHISGVATRESGEIVAEDYL